MKQKVHSVSYLAKAEFEFKNGVYDLVALPAGAEVLKVSLELVGNPNSGLVSVFLKDKITNHAVTLLNDVATNFTNTTVSTKDYTVTSNKVVTLEVTDANESNIKGVLRVLYFLPSVIEVEY